MKSFIYIPEISIYIFINIKISIKRCKNVEFFTKNALQTAKTKILFKIVEKVSKYEKNNTIHNGCWRSGPEQSIVVSSYVQCYFGEYFKVNRLFQGLCSANSMKLIFTSNWSIYLSIVIHFIFKSSNAILMVGFVLTNFLMQMLKYLIHAKYMQKIHHLQDQWEKRQILNWR